MKQKVLFNCGEVMKLSPNLNLIAINSLAIGIFALTSLAAQAADQSVGVSPVTVSPPGNAAASPERKPKEDLPNFHQVHPYLYRGGEPTEAGLQKLKDMGVKTIIDLRGSEAMVKQEAGQANALGMKSINLPMSNKAPTTHQVHKFIDSVEKAQTQGDKSPVYVHCAHGSDRTGCMVGIWRVTHDGYNYDQAYKEMRKYYFGPKFTNLSGTVQKYAGSAPQADAAKSGPTSH